MGQVTRLPQTSSRLSIIFLLPRIGETRSHGMSVETEVPLPSSLAFSYLAASPNQVRTDPHISKGYRQAESSGDQDPKFVPIGMAPSESGVGYDAMCDPYVDSD